MQRRRENAGVVGGAQKEKNGCEWMEMRRDKRIRGRGRNGGGLQWKSEIMLERRKKRTNRRERTQSNVMIKKKTSN